MATDNIQNLGSGPKNIAAGSEDQLRQSGSSTTQFNNSILYGFGSKQVETADEIREEREDFLRSLAFDVIYSRRHDIGPAHYGTCDWFFSTEEFHKWHRSTYLSTHNGVIWIKGKPGAGKSMLMKHILEKGGERLFSDHIIAAHFFNARGEALERTGLGMLRSLLYQLLRDSNLFYQNFVPRFREKQRASRGSDWQWSESELQEFLHSVARISGSPPLLLLIDAVDECAESDVRSLIEFLESLSISATQTNASLKICLSSRHYPSISMGKMLRFTIEQSKEHEADISNYLVSRLRIRNASLEKEVLTRANGIFLWVVIVVALLNRAYDEGREGAMWQILNESFDYVEMIFLAIISQDSSIAAETMDMLQWVLLSMRPLEPPELFAAVFKRTPPSDDLIERRIITSCQGLVEVRKDIPSSVQFIHLSMSDFLLQENGLKTLDPTLGSKPIITCHGRLWARCKTCIEQLNTDMVELGQIDKLRAEDPFLGYAACHILDHAERVLAKGTLSLHSGNCIDERDVADTSSEKPIREWLRHSDTWFTRWKSLIMAAGSNEERQALGNGAEVGLVYVLALRRLPNLCRAALYGVDVNALGGYYGTPLQAASYGGHNETINLLLEQGAKINIQSGYYGNALQAASYGGHIAAINLLLRRGADINAQAGYYGYALQAAAFTGHQDTVELLLREGADVNAQGGYYGYALQAAAFTGHQDTVELLLREGADVNAHGGYYGHALQAASYGGYQAIVELLLQNGANISAQGGYYGYALQAASHGRCRDIVELLIDRGANVNSQGGYFGTALQAASARGHQEFVNFLLESNADVNLQGGHFGNALQAASVNGYREILKMLLQKGANVSAHGGCFGTALQAASFGGSPATVKLLVGEGADVLAAGGKFGSPLQAACREGHYEVVQLLVEKGADVNTQGGKYGNALQAAASRGNEDIVKFLLDHGADINAHSGKYDNALQAAKSKGYGNVERLLIGRGAVPKVISKEKPRTANDVENDQASPINAIAINEADESTEAVITGNKETQKATMKDYTTNRPLYELDIDADFSDTFSNDTFSKSTVASQSTRMTSDPAYSDSSAFKTNRRVNLIALEQVREENDSKGDSNSKSAQDDGTWQSDTISSTSQGSTIYTNEEKQNACARFSRALVKSLPWDFHYSVVNESSSAHFVHHLSQAIKDFATSGKASTTIQLHRKGLKLVQRVRTQIAHQIDSDIITIEQTPDAARKNITAFGNQSQINARHETAAWVASSDAYPPLSQMIDEDVVPNQHNTHFDALSQTSEDSSMDDEDEIDVNGKPTNAAIFMKFFSKDTSFDSLAKETERLLQKYHSSKLDWIRYKTSLCLRRNLSHSVSENMYAVFNIRWSLRDFFLNNYDHGLNQKLDTVLAVTGNVREAWACSIKEYFQWCWPSYGLHLLRAFERGLLPESVETNAMKSTTERCPSGVISVASDLETVWVNGTEDFIICMAQGIAWLVAACQEKQETLSYAYVDFFEAASVKDSTGIILEVGVKLEKPLLTEVESCWHQVVGPAIIIAGFPIPERRPEQKGLEVSIPTMAALAGTPQAVTFNGGYVFKGRSHAVIPVTNASDWVQWHLLSVFPGKLRWTDIDKLCPGRVRNHTNEVPFFSARAFLGWCPKVHEILGTSEYDYKSMQYSSATMRSRSAQLDNLSFGFSQWGQLVAEVSIGRKDGFRNPISGSQDDFDQLLDDARDIHIILHDTAHQRAFQVTGEDYILHVIHQLRVISPKYHTSDNLDFAAPDRGLKPTRETMLSNADKIVANRTPISQSATQPQSFKEEVKLIYSTLDGLWAHEYTQRDGKSKIVVDLQRGVQGWEHMDIVNKSREMKPKCAPLESSGQWAKYARDIEALVLFGAGFKDVMRPLEPNSLCAAFKTLPVGRSYLAVRTESLRALFNQQGCCTDQTRLTLSGLALQGSSDIFLPCPVDKHPEEMGCSASRLVQVIKRRKSDHSIIPLGTNGAIIMGARPGWAIANGLSSSANPIRMPSTIFPFRTSSKSVRSKNQVG